MIVTKQLRAEIRSRREPTTQVDGKEVPGSVPFLREMLATVADPHDRDDLLGELAGEYLRAGLEDEHLLVQRERVANHPDAAVMWLGLAQSLSMRNDGTEEARQAAAKGVEISRRQGALVRYALVCQADVARRINDPALFAHSLAELIADAPNQREDDCGLNEQLVVDLPEGFCDPELEQQYRRCLAV
jgi:hypothetical protein